MKIKELVQHLEIIAPLAYQESYDNAGLIVGDGEEELKGIIICLDVTEQVVQEAIDQGRNMILAHHPIIFKSLKKLSGNHYVERILIKAIRNDIAIYSAHTNLDNIFEGVNKTIGEKLGLKNMRILSPMANNLRKLVVFVPGHQATEVREALFRSGAGKIGGYDSCSFNLEGLGSFRAGDQTNPFVGEKGKLHFEPEVRIETIYPAHAEAQILRAMIKAHPYEEVAYDIYPVQNINFQIGAGIIGDIDETTEHNFLAKLKSTFDTAGIRHSAFLGKKIERVAICGGSGSFLIRNAIAASADVFVSADFKYHDFFEADNKILMTDIGHFESEQFTQELFYQLIVKKFPNIAVDLTQVGKNPVYYY